MHPRSLRAKLNIIFILATLLLAILFGVLYQRSQTRSLEVIEMQERANIHYLYLYYLQYGKVDTAYLESQNIRVVNGGGENVFLRGHFSDRNGTRHFATVTIKLERYIFINNDRFNLVLENMNKPKFPLDIAIGFGGSLLLLGFFYWWVIRSIQPLTELKKTIEKFSEGDLNIACRSDKGDEIAEVANAFDAAVKKIRDLLHARQLLLRAIMHELKTPIAKGRLLSEMVKDERQKNRFHTIFERLNLLINEFAKVEQIASKNFNAVFKPYKISDITEASIDMLMLDDPARHIELHNNHDTTVQADFELLSLAIKNLLDNGIKYSQTRQVNIVINNNQVIVSNYGERLKEPLEHYFAPFHTSRDGLGLGLYIVKSILDIHKMELSYVYDNGENTFSIKTNSALHKSSD
jgi:two-component system OmpR family sensor kinase